MEGFKTIFIVIPSVAQGEKVGGLLETQADVAHFLCIVLEDERRCKTAVSLSPFGKSKEDGRGGLCA